MRDGDGGHTRLSEGPRRQFCDRKVEGGEYNYKSRRPAARPAKYSHDCSSLLHYRHGPSQLKNNWTAGQAPAYEAAQQVFDGFCFGMLGLIGSECTPMIPPQTCRPTAYSGTPSYTGRAQQEYSRHLLLEEQFRAVRLPQ